MDIIRHGRLASLFVCLFLSAGWLTANGAEQHALATDSTATSTVAKWIWNPVQPAGSVPSGACFFRHTFKTESPAQVLRAKLDVAADDVFEVFVNGHRVGSGGAWKHFTRFDISKLVVEGDNTIAVKVINRQAGNAGLAARIELGNRLIVSDASWKCSVIALPKWQYKRFADSAWKPAKELGAWGQTQPWVVRELADQPNKTIHDPNVQLAAWNDDIKKKVQPLLLKPMQKNLGWLRKDRPNRSNSNLNVDTTAPDPPLGIPSKRPVTNGPNPKVIENPHIAAIVKPTTPAPEPIQPGVGKKIAAVPEATAVAAPPEQVTKSRRFEPRDGFAVEQVLAGAKTGSLISATFNEFGQILAGQENGPLMLMVDSNNDGELDEVRPYSTKVKNCQGILALSGMVFVVAEGDDGTGLYRLSDEDRNGDLEEATLLVGFDVEAKEHGPHGIVLGPDGKLYITVGNHAKLQGNFSKRSPRRHLYEGDLIPRYEDPGGHASGIRLPAGFILRTDISGKQTELFASGLRNSYDLAFNLEGQLFTWDSDMESDSSTNWYRPTRFYHVPPGGDFGWRSGWAKWPSYYHDAVPPVAETGRGSPTGIVFYQHHAYPVEYRDRAFMADWSEGRILTARMTGTGGSYSVKTETFLEGKPLNVTDIEVGPDGMLYFVTGGRGSNGGIYRVKWTGVAPEKPKTKGFAAVLNSPQINSSWGRQRAAGIQQRMGVQWNEEIVSAVTDTTLPTRKRLQALQLMQWVGPIPSAQLLVKLSRDGDMSVRKSAAFLMASSKQEEVALRLLEMLSDTEAAVRRQACESLVRNHRSVPYEFVAPLLASQDRFENLAARRLLSLDHPDEWLEAAFASDDAHTIIQAGTVLMTAWPTTERAIAVSNRAQQLMGTYLADEEFTDLLRLLQITIVRGELLPTDIPQLATTLAEEFPSGNLVMNRELIRLLVRLEVKSIKDRFLDYIDSDIPTSERIHLATHLRFLKADWTTDQKLRIMKHLTPPENAGNSVVGYLQNVSRDFGKQLDPTDDSKIISNGQEYPSAALEAVLRLPNRLSKEQIQLLSNLDRSVTRTDETSKKLKVAVLAVLARDGTEESMAHIRTVYDNEPQRRVEAVIGLAEKPVGANWDYLVRSLPLVDGEIARELITKLTTVEKSPSEPEPYRQVIMTGVRLGDKGAAEAIRLLEHWRGFAPADDAPPWSEALQAWQNWFAKTFPEAPTPQLSQSTTPKKWDETKLLHQVTKSIKSGEGSVAHGKLVFEKAKCASCHQYGDLGESMGPDLSTVSKRFLPKEILDSVVYPSRVISDQYRAKTLITDDGVAHTGIVGAGGADELVVLQLDGTKVRIPKSEIDSTIPSKVSAMPEGLLDGLTYEEIVDLMAFLNQAPNQMPNQNVAEDVKRTFTR